MLSDLLGYVEAFKAIDGAVGIASGGLGLLSAGVGWFGRRRWRLLLGIAAGVVVVGFTIWHALEVRAAYREGDAAGYARAAAEIQAATQEFNEQRREFDRVFDQMAREFEEVKDERDQIAEDMRRQLAEDPRGADDGIDSGVLRDFLRD